MVISGSGAEGQGGRGEPTPKILGIGLTPIKFSALCTKENFCERQHRTQNVSFSYQNSLINP